MQRELSHLWFALISFSLFLSVMVGVLAYPNHLTRPIHHNRIQSTLVEQTFQGSSEIDSPSVSYDNPSPLPLKDALWAEKKRVELFTHPTDLNLRGMVYIPSDRGWGQVYLPIYEGVSNQTLYYGTGTTRPNQVMGYNHFITTAYNNNDDSWLTTHPSFYSGLTSFTKEILGTVFWATDGESIFKWKVDTLSRVSDVREWSQKSTEKSGRMTLVTPVTEEYVVLSGVLQSQQPIESDAQTALELFPELSVLQIKRPKGAGHVITNNPSLATYKKGINHSLCKNKWILLLFKYLDQILIIWSCLNLVWGSVILHQTYRNNPVDLDNS